MPNLIINFISYDFLFRAVEIVWHQEMEQITLKRFAFVEKSPTVETKDGHLREYQTKYWKVLTTKKSQMFPAGK